MRQNPAGSSLWTRVSIPVGVGLFVFALAGSAFFGSTTPTSARVAGTDLCGRPRAGSAQQSMGIWHRCHHTDGLELPQSIRDSSLPERGRAVLVSCAHGACEPASADAGDGWGRGPLSAHHRLHGRVPAAAASRKAMGQVLCRGFLALGYFTLIIAIARPR
jgi:hypothetical protein